MTLLEISWQRTGRGGTLLRGKQVGNLFFQLGLIIFGNPYIITTSGDNVTRKLALGVHGITNDDFTPQIQHLKQSRSGHNLVFFAFNFDLHQHQPFTGQIGG